MTCYEAIDRLKDLQMLRRIYVKLGNDSESVLYSKFQLGELIKHTTDEIERISELMENMELLDSYDQNTGKLNKIYRERNQMDDLLKIVGGPRNDK